MRARPLIWFLPLAALVLLLIANFFPYLRAAALVATGRQNGCPAGMALHTPAGAREQNITRQRIEAASRRIETDGSAGLELWETPAGRYWTPQRERSGYWLADMLAEEATDVYIYDDIRVRRGDVVLDCGANVGTFARHALDAGARKVVAIEPGPDSVECLRRSFAAEVASGRVIVVPKGVWDKEGEMPLIVDKNGSIGDGFVIRRPGDRLSLVAPLAPIDTLVSELKLERVDFIKMDIEGAEKEALRGARETLRRFRPRLAISAYHLKEDPVEIPALVRDLEPGYRGSCGSCVLERRRIAPKVLFFAPSDVAYSGRDAAPFR